MSHSSGDASFDAFYASIRGKLAEIEPRRKRALGIFLAILVATLAVGAAVAWALFQPEPPFGLPQLTDWPPLLFLVGLPVIAINAIAWYTLTSSYKDTTYVSVLDALVPAARPGLKFTGADRVDEMELRRLGLFDEISFNRFAVTDAVSGRAGNLDIRFSRIELIKRSGGKNKSSATIFEGILYDAKRADEFESSTYVLPDTAERLFGEAGRALQFDSNDLGDRLTIADAEFEKQFIVYTSLPDEAQRILSPMFRRRLLQLRERLGRRIRVGFVDDRILVAVDTSGPLFAPPVFGSLLRPEIYRPIWDRVQTFGELGNELDLENVRP